jgi:Peptidase family S41
MPTPLFALSLLLLAPFAAISNGQAPTLPKIEPRLLRVDLQIARMSLEEGHSGLYRYTPKPELDRAFDSASEKLDHPMNALEFLRILAPVVAEIKCGHTSVRPPVAVRDALDKTIPLLPLDVVVLNGQVYVTREYLPSEQHLSGLQIHRINRIAIDTILATMLAATSGDAESQTVRPARVSESFPWLLYDLLGMESPFQLEFQDSKTGRLTTLELGGVTFPDREKVAAARYPQDKEPEDSASLKFVGGGKVAILTIHEFYGTVEKKELSDYFDDVFRQLQQRKSDSLIIDLRNTGGGRDFLGKKLLSFLLDKPFHYYDDLIYNGREFDFFRYAEDAKPIPADMVEKRADGKFHDIKHPNLGIQQPSEPHFSGKVIVLMNGGSFSTTCEFLSNLHYNKRATFVGEEAGGGYYGNTSGPTIVATLPNTKVRLVVPLRTYYLAVKDGIPNRSILPDYEVKASIGDLLSDNDVVMLRALELAKKN